MAKSIMRCIGVKFVTNFKVKNELRQGCILSTVLLLFVVVLPMLQCLEGVAGSNGPLHLSSNTMSHGPWPSGFVFEKRANRVPLTLTGHITLLICINRQNIEDVHQFVYLVRGISADGGTTLDIPNDFAVVNLPSLFCLKFENADTSHQHKVYVVRVNFRFELLCESST